MHARTSRNTTKVHLDGHLVLHYHYADGVDKLIFTGQGAMAFWLEMNGVRQIEAPHWCTAHLTSFQDDSFDPRKKLITIYWEGAATNVNLVTI